MSVAYDVVVVGAGPYGLSVAAHLRGRGLKTAVFGRTLGMWRAEGDAAAIALVGNQSLRSAAQLWVCPLLC